MKNFLFNVGKNALSLLLFLITIFIAIALWAHYYALPQPLSLHKTHYHTVKKGQRLSNVARELVAKDIMNLPTAVVWVVSARLRGKAHRIKAGEYELKPNISAYYLLDLLVKGKAIQHSLTLLEGWNFRQVFDAVAQHPKLKHTLKGQTPEQIMKILGHSKLHPEGRFYPDTYYFNSHFSDLLNT